MEWASGRRGATGLRAQADVQALIKLGRVAVKDFSLPKRKLAAQEALTNVAEQDPHPARASLPPRCGRKPPSPPGEDLGPTPGEVVPEDELGDGRGDLGPAPGAGLDRVRVVRIVTAD